MAEGMQQEGTGKAPVRGMPQEEKNNIRRLIESGTRVSKDVWLASRTLPELKAWEAKKRKRGSTGKSRYRRGAFKRPRYNSNGPRPLIVSAGVARSIGGLGTYGYTENPRNPFGRDYMSGGGVHGYGDYNVTKNSLLDRIDVGVSPPRVRNTNMGEATIINHREYLGDLYSGSGTPTAFTLQTFSLNPGNSLLFPFLGTIAHKFQEWEARGILFELKTLSSDYAAALSMGSMFMAADYNSLSPAPSSKIALENMEYADSCKPSRSLIMPIECDPKISTNTHLNVADNENYEGGDRRLFDLCNVYIGSQGVPTAATPIAEIWVTYEIALFKPIIQNGSTDEGIQSLHVNMSGITSAKPFGTAQSIVNGSSSGFSVDASSDVDCRVYFPPVEGTYLFVWQASYIPLIEAIVPIFPVLSYSGSVSTVNNFGDQIGPNQQDELHGGELKAGPGPTNTMIISSIIVVTRPVSGPFTGYVSFDGSAFIWATATSWGDIYATQLNPLLVQ